MDGLLQESFRLFFHKGESGIKMEWKKETPVWQITQYIRMTWFYAVFGFGVALGMLHLADYIENRTLRFWAIMLMLFWPVFVLIRMSIINRIEAEYYRRHDYEIVHDHHSNQG